MNKIVNQADPVEVEPQVVALDEPIEDEGERSGTAEERTIELEIQQLRAELGDLVGEIDRRRHEVTNIQLQARRHSTTLIVVGVAGAILLVSMAAYARRARQPDPLTTRMRKLGHAVAVVTRDPDRLLDAVERKPISKLAMMSALTRAAGMAGRYALRPSARV